ncbi:hypothetical protein [Solitalea koreensis]|uniref:Uncharacterized protein n=1 Tax=Solitalea koreensis TaxID=543615 RepID=A0A521BMA5_9SPHI|nr:hypothetical protein [Solitalea koreensis]SMO48284.1 hypothetical protein SAMN06265350_102337 [Solitalea koreensis]
MRKTQVKLFSADNFPDVENNTNRWLTKNSDIKIVSISHQNLASELANYVSILVVYEVQEMY